VAGRLQDSVAQPSRLDIEIGDLRCAPTAPALECKTIRAAFVITIVIRDRNTARDVREIDRIHDKPSRRGELKGGAFGTVPDPGLPVHRQTGRRSGAQLTLSPHPIAEFM
jgi:hypothetical protein